MASLIAIAVLLGLFCQLGLIVNYCGGIRRDVSLVILPLRSPPGATKCKLICCNITWVRCMPFNPFEMCLGEGITAIRDFAKYALHEVSVLDQFACRRFPSVLLPVHIPNSHTIDCIFTVGHNSDIAILGRSIKRTPNSSQLCSLVGLARAGQRLGKVPKTTNFSQQSTELQLSSFHRA